jgi:hypothetical protein
MADPEMYGDQESWGAASREYGQVERYLERAYQKWEEAQQAIEAIEQEKVQRAQVHDSLPGTWEPCTSISYVNKQADEL